MDGLIRRGYTDADAAPIAGLLTAAERHAGGHLAWTAEEVRSLLTATVRDQDRDALLVFDAGNAAGPAERPPAPAGPEKAESEKVGSERAGSERAGSERAGSERAGSERAGSERAGSERAGSGKAGAGATLVGMATVATPQEGGGRMDLLGGVLPGWRGRGIGRDLMGWQLRRGAEIHRATAPDADWAVRVGANSADDDTLRLCRRFGLEPVRHWFDMVAPTAGAPAIEVPDGLVLAGYRPGRERDLHAAHVEAFADHWGSEPWGYQSWVTLTVGSETFVPELSWLALDGDEIAGYLLVYREVDPTHAHIGHVAVRRPWRRRGLAAAMLGRALAAAARAGLSAATLTVDAANPTGAVGVYERVGFATESRGVTYATSLPAIPREARQPS